LPPLPKRPAASLSADLHSRGLLTCVQDKHIDRRLPLALGAAEFQPVEPIHSGDKLVNALHARG
jgi:hypothetical protein